MQTIETIDVPHSREAESGIIGCCMLEPELLDAACEAVTPDDFYDLRLKNTYELMLDMRRQMLPIDEVTVQEEAKSLEGGIQALGGMAMLAQHRLDVPSAANLPYYLSIAKKKSARRKLEQAARLLLQDARGDDEQVLEDHTAKLNELLRDDRDGGEVSVKDAVKQAIAEIEEAHASSGSCSGVSTGFPSIDHITGGLQKGDMLVIAARPSVGKTSLAMSIAENVAVEGGIPVGVMSMEMTAASIIKRLVSSMANVDGRKLLTGSLTDSEIATITQKAAKITKSKLFLDERANLTPMQLLGKARQWKLKHDIQLLVIDYLGLMRAKGDNKTDEVSKCSAAVKQAAKELDIPVIVLCQLNRKSESEQRPPMLSDLRDSGSIEQDADLVGLMHRLDTDGDETVVRLNVAKHRNGPVGFCDLEFLKEITKYREYLPEYE